MHATGKERNANVGMPDTMLSNILLYTYNPQQTANVIRWGEVYHKHLWPTSSWQMDVTPTHASEAVEKHLKSLHVAPHAQLKHVEDKIK